MSIIHDESQMEVLSVGNVNKFVGVKIVLKAFDSEVLPILTICTEELPVEEKD